MRIRKRQVPLPLSSLSPVPLSDLLQVQLHPRTPPPPDKTPPSLANHQLRPPIDGQDTPTNDAAALESDHDSKLLVDGERLIVKKIGNDSSDSAMERLFGGSAPNSSTHQVGRSYDDGERAFPLKKKRGSFEMDKEKKMMRSKPSLKTKVKKKCNSEDDGYGEMIIKNESHSKRRGNRGNVLMEGSRCSRVNGRGWRCCQPTLVGYSLCEHHLGKGRLRSIMNVKSRAGKMLPSSSSQAAKLEPINEADDDDDDDVEMMTLIMTGAKKGMKIGVVKARSMSSLLNQADNKNGGASSVIPAESSYGKENSTG